MSEFFIGLISGTSIDNIDAVLVDFDHNTNIIATHSEPIPEALKEECHALCSPGNDEINRTGQVDIKLGEHFATATKNLLQKACLTTSDIKAIGCHGQTIRHQPAFETPFTRQVGDPNTIAALTNITTITDFRRRDMALGGQGAPLVPAFHEYMFRDTHVDRVIVNIGGIANITVLPADPNQNVMGFDTGPGNTLLDAWTRKQLNKDFDENGQWAASGKVNTSLLEKLLSDDYFKKTAPKSTGREYFNLRWLGEHNIKPEDIQATLLHLTAQSILSAIKAQLSSGEIFICGGGVHNKTLLQAMGTLRGNFSLQSTSQLGIDPDWVEAACFAWLAKKTLEKQPGNLPSVTGANSKTILGGVYFA